MYKYNTCWTMPAGARGEIIQVACHCSLLDLRGELCSSSSAGSSSSSWVIVSTYTWRELGGGVTCEKRFGLIQGNLLTMVFLFSIGIRVILFGMGTWNKIYDFCSGNFRDKISLTCPWKILCPSLSVCSLINFCKCFLGNFLNMIGLAAYEYSVHPPICRLGSLKRVCSCRFNRVCSGSCL